MINKQISVGIIGAGVAGLTFARRISGIDQVCFKIFEKTEKGGGRVRGRKVGKEGFADLGANIIDF